MAEAFICDAVRTPIGRYGGALSSVRADDLAAIPLTALVKRNPSVRWAEVDDLIYGCANQAGEDNRNVGRMAALLAGLPIEVPGTTINRLCGSGMDAVGQAARAIRAGDADLMIAGGVESMSRAPFVMPKAETAFSRQNSVYDTTIGWRFPNPKMHSAYGTDSMPQTADNVAADWNVSREDQDLFAARSQARWDSANKAGHLTAEIVPVVIKTRKGEIVVDRDEYIRHGATMDAMQKLRPAFAKEGSVTAANASGLNDGAAGALLMSADEAEKRGITPLARIASYATVGLDPSIMGVGPVYASRKALEKAGWSVDDLDLVEANEAFAAQACAVNNDMGWDPDIVNVNGGAIAIGHPIGASGARVLNTLLFEMQRRDAKKGLATLCIGGGMGVAMCLERP